MPFPKSAALVMLVSASALADEVPFDVHDFKIIPRESGDVNYYKVIATPDLAYIHSSYQPGMETAVLGHDVPDSGKGAQKVRWSWRALELPREGNECQSGHGDSAAVVYMTWKRGLKYYTLKYVWSSTGPKDAVCDQRRNPIVNQDTIVLETGYPVGVWKNEEVDLVAEFHKHFGEGEVPEFKGVGIMSDGDQTNSESSADFGRFVYLRKR